MMRIANRRNTVLSLLFAAAFLLFNSPAYAQGFGVRGGLSVNPDQIYVGGHYETGALIESLYFKPNLELGFGEDVTALTLNFEGIWKFPERRGWRVYAGGGPALARYAVDDFSDSGAGFNLLAGAENDRGLMFEVKVGMADSPDLKFGVGWTFK